MRKCIASLAAVVLLASLSVSCSEKKGRHIDDDDRRTEKTDKPKSETEAEPVVEETAAALPSNFMTPATMPAAEEFDYDAVVLDFTATWCPPCQQLHPALVKAARNYPNVAFISIDIDQYSELMEATGQNSIPYVVLLNNNGISTYLGTGELLPADKLFNRVSAAAEGQANDRSDSSHSLYYNMLQSMLGY